MLIWQEHLLLEIQNDGNQQILWNQEVKDLISKEVIRTNEHTALQIRKFEMIPKELDHEEGELTATQKIKRNVLEEQFSDLIESMYKWQYFYKHRLQALR